jgi:hypothetical protein
MNTFFLAPSFVFSWRAGQKLPPVSFIGPEFSATHTARSAELRKVAAAAAQLAMKWGKLSLQVVNVRFGDVILHFRMVVGNRW